MKLTRLIGAGCALAFAAIASAGVLSIGDKAPDLGKDVSWIKGESVTEFEKGHIYVLDFWATWCGPCVKAIPHMDEIAEKHEADGVTVIGVAIWPNDRMTPTAEYVEQRGDDMSYTICADIDGATAEKFMKATGSDGIPTCMIINREGLLAWVGHPMAGMDEALSQIIAGTYDIEDAAAANRKKMAVIEKAQPLMKKAETAYAMGEWETVVTTLQELARLDSEQYGRMTLEAFNMMITRLHDEQRAYNYAREMLEGDWKEDITALNAVAWIIADTEELEHRDLDLAFKAASKANAISGGEDPMVLDTLAAVYFLKGDVKQAIDTQRKAISHADPEFAEQLKPALDKYLAAANEG
ncbi:MAG: redoxin domain-containing protein [Phycisphaeraceae bacterium]|nr:redoxin domain-containing protein [Phycisphaeraceae bacterium]